MHNQRILSFILLLLIFTSGLISAQETPTPDDETATIELELFRMPFADEMTLYGVVPSEWDEVQAGTVIRAEEDGANVTYLLHLATPEITLDDALPPLLESLQLEALPEEPDEYEGLFFTWTVYEITYQPTEDETLVVWMATAEDEFGAYIIALQSLPDEAEALYESVFVPALDAFGLSLEEVTAYLGIADLTRVEIPEFGISADVPTLWRNVNPGAYMRGESEVDFTTLLIQTSEDLEEREFADLLRESIGVPASLPIDGETVQFDEIEWTLYTMTFDAAGDFTLTLTIATTHDDTYTYMVALLADAEESDTLLDEILIPVMRSIRG